ncbi:MAG: YbbR-like domain-containing protein [Candidatus Kaelpia aquatica]|nr:YbbR-like domain-containing protein [Candidatus Kaelpia aquatica]
MKLIAAIKSNFGYKLIALLLAVTTYLYVQGEIGIKGIGFGEKELLEDVISKVVPIKASIKGEPPEGYKVLKSNISLTPERVIIMGKKDDIMNIAEVATQEIDVRKFTHTQVLSVPLLALENAIIISSKTVTVEIPIVSLR